MERFAPRAEFEVKPGMLAACPDVARLDARRSGKHEPGCFRFDVPQDPLAPRPVCFHEICADEAALLAHRAMPRGRTWSRGDGTDGRRQEGHAHVGRPARHP